MRSEIKPAGLHLSPWFAVPLVLVVAAGSGYLGARWAAERLRAELGLRPPVILFDMAGAVRGAGPERFGTVVARAKKQAQRLAAGGFLVLDAQAVIAAPPELYLAPIATPETAGDARR